MGSSFSVSLFEIFSMSWMLTDETESLRRETLLGDDGSRDFLFTYHTLFCDCIQI